MNLSDVFRPPKRTASDYPLGELVTGDNELEHIALAYALLKRTVASDNPHKGT